MDVEFHTSFEVGVTCHRSFMELEATNIDRLEQIIEVADPTILSLSYCREVGLDRRLPEKFPL